MYLIVPTDETVKEISAVKTNKAEHALPPPANKKLHAQCFQDTPRASQALPKCQTINRKPFTESSTFSDWLCKLGRTRSAEAG